MTLPKIVDLHCDLLCYLAEGANRTAYEPLSNCSIPQLKAGGISLQTLAIFTETKKDSVLQSEKQFRSFLGVKDSKEVKFCLAIENASGLCGEDDLLQEGLKRLERFQKEGGPVLYVSLTWNTENRFGGGNVTKVGLKKDGEALLEFLCEKDIPIDFSHTSDALAYDIFNYIEKKNIPLRVLASHSNFRKILDHPRNLPDEFAQEIMKRGGLIGLNLVRGFIGKEPTAFLDHVEHAFSLGGQNHLCFGSDFFPEDDLSPELDYLKPFFFSDYNNSSCYPRLYSLLQTRFPKEVLEAVAHKNFMSFYDKKNVLAKSL